MGELGSIRILLWISRIDTIYTRTLEHHISLDLNSTEHRSRIGSKVWIARTARNNHHRTFRHQAKCLIRRIEFAYRLHTHTSHHANLLTCRFERRTQGKGIDNGCQHTHLITFHTVKTPLRATQSAEDISSTYHNAHFNTHLSNLLNLLCIVSQSLLINTITFAAHETLTREF